LLTPTHPENPPANPLVTMIVLSYNHSRFVLETLESVKAQTYKNTQLIILDDCSSDDSVAIIDRWLRENEIRCTFIRHQKNQGICKSLNEALAVSTGKYVSMVASDDIWLPDKIESQVAIMESQPDSVGVLYSDALHMGEDGRRRPGSTLTTYWTMSEMPQGQILDTLVQGNFIPGMTTLIRRSCYDKVGLYDENLPWEDWDMWMRIARHYSFICSPTPSATYRVHEKSLSHSDPVRLAKEMFKVGLKQLHLGDLTEGQKSKLTGTLVHSGLQLYGRNDPETSDILLTLWRATGDKRVGCMYWFVRLGVSYRNWLRANSCRLTLRRVRRIISGSS
jgi:GT2 family glycosyltransferase